mmetsp:Transcript_22446/g.46773  ORF Transcript_22446/g.46773 Transcript_22446/m.46773 type:complete len:222 (-) Transcript_22446:1154-1819(-)
MLRRRHPPRPFWGHPRLPLMMDNDPFKLRLPFIMSMINRTLDMPTPVLLAMSWLALCDCPVDKSSFCRAPMNMDKRSNNPPKPRGSRPKPLSMRFPPILSIYWICSRFPMMTLSEPLKSNIKPPSNTCGKPWWKKIKFIWDNTKDGIRFVMNVFIPNRNWSMAKHPPELMSNGWPRKNRTFSNCRNMRTNYWNFMIKIPNSWHPSQEPMKSRLLCREDCGI